MKITATPNQIFDLIAVLMVYCEECNRVSAPRIKPCPYVDGAPNWDTWDWQGDPAAIGPCQAAMSEIIAGLKRTYHLGSNREDDSEKLR